MALFTAITSGSTPREGIAEKIPSAISHSAAFANALIALL
jgi:hypothetical protein